MKWAKNKKYRHCTNCPFLTVVVLYSNISSECQTNVFKHRRAESCLQTTKRRYARFV